MNAPKYRNAQTAYAKGHEKLGLILIKSRLLTCGNNTARARVRCIVLNLMNSTSEDSKQTGHESNAANEQRLAADSIDQKPTGIDDRYWYE